MDISKKQRQIIKELGRNLIRDGIIQTKGSSKEKIIHDINDYLNKNLQKFEDFEFLIDYRKSILKNAKRFQREEDYYSSIVFYALWVEHWFNQMILIAIKRKKIRADYYMEIIRSNNFKSKSTWLWELLEYSPLNMTHLNAIIKLFEFRNSFIHYKWKTYTPKYINVLTDQLKDLTSFANSINKTIVYLKSYESKHIFKNHKNII